MLTRLLLALALALAAGPVPAQQQLSREAALAALKSPDAVERGRGIVGLARAGGMADTPALVERLRDANEELRVLAEQALWIVWSRSGDPAVDKVFEQGLDEMGAGKLPESIATFTRVIEMKPEFAEGWNKRATVYFVAGDFANSLKDCAEVIKRNPSHFGALSGYGQIYLGMGELEKARDYFKRALEVNPNLDGVEFNLRTLERVLEERRRKGA
jgi:tetratricopeptide (TPR) repeat protein